MSGLQLVGPYVPYRVAQHQRHEHRASDYAMASAQPCPYCESGLYASVPSPCPNCGNEIRAQGRR
jgi:hypothetical protein